MRGTATYGALAALALFSSVPALAQTNLVANGTFETGNLSGWMHDSRWRVGGPGDGPGSGYYATGLADLANQGHLSQRLSLIPGETYNLSFNFSTPGGGFPNYVTVTLGGEHIVTTSPAMMPGPYFETTFVAPSGNLLDLNVDGYTQVLKMDNISITSIAAYGPASVAQLARASADAYHEDKSTIGDFASLGNIAEFGDGLTMHAYGAPDDSHFIVAFEGTNSFKDWIVNGAVSGIANSTHIEYVSQSLVALSKFAQAHPGANIQLTGHSLGGALAQVIGTATGLQATAFDAPGSAELYFALSDILENAPELGGADVGTNYRLFGDQISYFGTQLGSVITVGNENSYCCAPTDFYDLTGIFTSHSADVLANELLLGAPMLDGFSGENFLAALQPILVPSGGSFFSIVSAFRPYGMDPDPGHTFTYLSDPGSPLFAWAMLPSLPGVSSYELAYLMGTEWHELTGIGPLSRYYFDSPVNGFRFSGIGAEGQLVETSDGFFVEVGFAADGEFRGQLQIERATAVPEPGYWMLLVAGFGIAGSALRRRCRSYPQNSSARVTADSRYPLTAGWRAGSRAAVAMVDHMYLPRLNISQ